MGRFFYGVLVGGAAMYLLDPEGGQERRQRLASWWRENRGSVSQAGELTARKIEDLKPAAQKAGQVAADRATTVRAKIRPGRQGQAEVEEEALPKTGRQDLP